jgi:hypothetical protein
MSTRAIVFGDLLALIAFAILGLASHEHGVTLAALARTFIPFAICWLAVAGALGLLRPDGEGKPPLGLLFVAAYLIAGVAALVGRSAIFDRTLVSAFFVIALVGNGLFLFAWRYAAVRRLSSRNCAVHRREATPS